MNKTIEQPMLHRCPWNDKNSLMIAYHDEEWGVPLHDDQKLFEFLVMDAFQAGLNWKIILMKRDNLRRALDDFDPLKIASYDQKKINALQNDAGIIRNKSKIMATVTNAKTFLKVQEEFGTFDKYIWSFTGGKILINKWQDMKQIPASTKESDAMSNDLKKRGFKFVGTTICYSFMQAAGMVNDHIVDCFRYRQVANNP
jgi:DNA-3-methyladenine glycosylase I